jgi:hypothetical protein
MALSTRPGALDAKDVASNASVVVRWETLATPSSVTRDTPNRAYKIDGKERGAPSKTFPGKVAIEAPCRKPATAVSCNFPPSRASVRLAGLLAHRRPGGHPGPNVRWRAPKKPTDGAALTAYTTIGGRNLHLEIATMGRTGKNGGALRVAARASGGAVPKSGGLTGSPAHQW